MVLPTYVSQAVANRSASVSTAVAGLASRVATEDQGEAACDLATIALWALPDDLPLNAARVLKVEGIAQVVACS